MITIPVQSKTIKKLGYDASRRVLRIMFNTNTVYEYDDVPDMMWSMLIDAPSKGEFFKNNIKGYYNTRKLS